MGIWGEPTSTINWCEDDYVVSPYIAEFWNTISNIWFIGLCLFGVFTRWKRGINLKIRFLLAYLSLFVVGIGSFLFHGTLWYEFQLLDEVAMLYCIAILLYSVLTEETITKYRYSLPIILITIPTSISAAYIGVYINPLFHEISYSVIVGIVILRSVYAILVEFPQDKVMRSIFLSGILQYLLGFVVWLLDNNFCPFFRGYLHMVWHFLAGGGSFLEIVFTECLYERRMGRVPDVRTTWMFPYVIPGEDKKKK